MLQLPQTLINTNNKWIKKSLGFILTSVSLAWHGRFFKDTYCIDSWELQANDSLNLTCKHLEIQ